MRPYIFVDPQNSKAVDAAQRFKHHEFDDHADTILVLGGDGTMIKAIHQLYDKGLPFYGINYGHVGFLLNKGPYIKMDRTEYELPLLLVQWRDEDLQLVDNIAVNDAWVERASPQTAMLNVEVDGATRLNKVYADGLLVASPQGSTAYARAMGGMPMPLDTKAIQLVGSNVSFPNWKMSMLSFKQKVRIVNWDYEKRPINLYADGVLLKANCWAAFISVHPKYKVRLLFDKDHNLAEKIAQMQFPK